MFGRRCDQPGPHGVPEDVFDEGRQAFVAPDLSVEVALLPQSPTGSLNEEKSRSLFGEANEVPEVGGLRQRGHDGVEMIRHETVRKKFKLLVAGDAQKLRQDQCDRGCVGEVATALVGADRQEILSETDVIDRIEATRATHQG
jgi:hypothetical protein